MILTKDFFQSNKEISFLKLSNDLNFDGLVNLLYAPNGTGKTTLLKALKIQGEKLNKVVFTNNGFSDGQSHSMGMD